MKNRKFVVVAFVVIAAMLMGVGYAALTDTLTIIGNANVDIAGANSVFDEKIYFSDAKVVKGVDGKDLVTFTPDDATYTVHGLATIADEAVFLFTITNDSNLDALISVGQSHPNALKRERFPRPPSPPYTVVWSILIPSASTALPHTNGCSTTAFLPCSAKRRDVPCTRPNTRAPFSFSILTVSHQKP